MSGKTKSKMNDKYSLSSFKLDELISNKSHSSIKTNRNMKKKFLNMKTTDIASRLGQFAWRQIVASTTPLPVIFR
jgi:hypothetical protein